MTPEQLVPYLKTEPKPDIKMPIPPLEDLSPGLRELNNTGHPGARQ